MSEKKTNEINLNNGEYLIDEMIKRSKENILNENIISIYDKPLVASFLVYVSGIKILDAYTVVRKMSQEKFLEVKEIMSSFLSGNSIDVDALMASLGEKIEEKVFKEEDFSSDSGELFETYRNFSGSFSKVLEKVLNNNKSSSSGKITTGPLSNE